jgi:signal peptidase
MRAVRIVSKCFSVLLTVVAVLAVAGLLAARSAGMTPATILSGSMRPTFNVGDMIFISPIRASQMRVGQIVTFARPNRASETLTHRVREIRTGGDVPTGMMAITTRGDANEVSEHWTIRADGQVAAFRARIPWVGHITQPLKGAGGPALLVLLVAMYLVQFLLRRIWSKPTGEMKVSRRRRPGPQD